MDETLCQTAIDISGRPYCSLSFEWSDAIVEKTKTSMIEHFLESFSCFKTIKFKGIWTR